MVPETLNHVLQTCYASHPARIKRHDEINTYLKRMLQDRGMTVHLERPIKVKENTYKPDLVIYTEKKVIILDTRIINDQFGLKKT